MQCLLLLGDHKSNAVYIQNSLQWPAEPKTKSLKTTLEKNVFAENSVCHYAKQEIIETQN